MSNVMIVFTQTFEIEYKKYRGKQKYDLKTLAVLIQRDLNKQICYLNRLYLKLKVTLDNHSLRMLAYYFEEEYIIIPLFVTDKNDKEYGQNMTWNSIQSKVELLFDKIIDDYDASRYISYPIG